MKIFVSEIILAPSSVPVVLLQVAIAAVAFVLLVETLLISLVDFVAVAVEFLLVSEGTVAMFLGPLVVLVVGTILFLVAFAMVTLLVCKTLAVVVVVGSSPAFEVMGMAVFVQPFVSSYLRLSFSGPFASSVDGIPVHTLRRPGHHILRVHPGPRTLRICRKKTWCGKFLSASYELFLPRTFSLGVSLCVFRASFRWGRARRFSSFSCLFLILSFLRPLGATTRCRSRLGGRTG